MARIRAALRVAFTLLALALAVTVAAPARAGSFTLRPFEGLYANLILAEVPQELYGQPIAEIRFDGNRRVESEAMNLEIDSAVGELLSARKLASDLRRLWALGKFTDVRVSGELTPAGVIVTFTVAERPTIRKIIVEGNDKKKLDDINEVLELEKNQILDLGAIKESVEKIRAMYVEEGFFLAEVEYALRPVEDSPGQVDVYFVIREGSEVIVRKITFVGNKAFSDEELGRYMGTRVGGYLSLVTKRAGGVFNREVFASDAQLLKAFYANHGYLDFTVKEPEMSLSPDRRFVYLTIPVEEGPQYRIGRIRAKEVLRRGEKPLFTEEILAESIDPILHEGDVASMGEIQKIMQNIERRYKDNGHANVNVIPDHRPDKENLKLYMTLEVDKGPLVYIERINIYGNDKTADKVIRREMAITEGDLYSESAKEISEFNVLRLGYFNDVTISQSQGSTPEKIVLNVEVTEKLTGTFQVGAGFSTIESFVLQAQVNYDNFLGRGTTVTVVAQLSALRRLFNVGYFTRYFLDSTWYFTASVFNSRDLFPGFDRQQTGFSISWGHPIPRVPNLVFFLGYSFEYVKIGFDTVGNFGAIFSPGTLANVPRGALISNLYTDGITSALTARIRYDTTDNYLFPTQGMRHEISGKFASKYFGSQNQYNRYHGTFRFYFPLIRSKQAFRAWLVFKTQLQIGFIHGPEANGVPIFARYFPGGIFGDGMIRGYRLRSLGPKISVLSGPDPTASLVPYPVGGNLLTSLNAELEFMIVPPANIKGVIFFDIGNAFNTEPHFCREPNPEQVPKADPCTGFSFRDLRYSMGFGFRWQSPIGPLRFEWGFPLDRQDATEFTQIAEDPVVFEFNVGNSF